jgi:CelD/BcsL family acetyltransferase involved in cellulose biosynthesis
MKPLSPSLGNLPAVSHRVLHSFEEAEAYRAAWDALVGSTGVDIYQTFDWSRLWWKYYRGKRELHLMLWFLGEELIGVVPGFTETLTLFPARVRVAKLIGADYSLTLCNLAVADEHLARVTMDAVGYFVGEKRCDLFLIGPLAGPRARIEDIATAGEMHEEFVGCTRTLGNTCNTFFTLPATFEAYLKGLDKKQRSNFKRMMEQSAKGRRMSFDVVREPTQVAAEFEKFAVDHRAQWVADGKLGHFDDWPHAGEFNRELVKVLGDAGRIRFYRILADDQVISSQFGYVFGRTVYWRLPARVRSAEWDRFSLGTLGLVKMIDALTTEGVTVIEGGRGHYAYKVHHGAVEFPLRTIQFRRRGPLPAIRSALFAAAARLLDIVYYKILFARLAPRFRFLQRTLWPVWIRSTW